MEKVDATGISSTAPTTTVEKVSVPGMTGNPNVLVPLKDYLQLLPPGSKGISVTQQPGSRPTLILPLPSSLVGAKAVTFIVPQNSALGAREIQSFLPSQNQQVQFVLQVTKPGTVPALNSVVNTVPRSTVLQPSLATAPHLQAPAPQSVLQPPTPQSAVSQRNSGLIPIPHTSKGKNKEHKTYSRIQDKECFKNKEYKKIDCTTESYREKYEIGIIKKEYKKIDHTIESNHKKDKKNFKNKGYKKIHCTTESDHEKYEISLIKEEYKEIDQTTESDHEKSMTEYESLLHKKRAENIATIKSLGLYEAKNDFSEAMHSMKKRRVLKSKERSDPIIQRKSKRRKLKKYVDYADICRLLANEKNFENEEYKEIDCTTESDHEKYEISSKKEELKEIDHSTESVHEKEKYVRSPLPEMPKIFDCSVVIKRLDTIEIGTIKDVKNFENEEYKKIGYTTESDHEKCEISNKKEEYKGIDHTIESEHEKCEISNKKEEYKEIDHTTESEHEKFMTPYERLLHRKKAENLECLKSLGLYEAKNDFSEAMHSMKKKKRELKFKERSDPIIQRASKRVKEHVEYTDSIRLTAKALRLLSPDQSFKRALKVKTQYEKLVEDFSEIRLGKVNDNKPVIYERNVLQQLSYKIFTCVVGSTVMSWFPSSENLLLGIGHNNGNLSFWKIKESVSNYYEFPVQSNRITNLQFDPYNAFHLISSSLDGSLLCCDIRAQMFSRVLKTSVGCTYFDFFSPATYIVAKNNGQVIIADRRTQHVQEDSRYCHSFSTNTVNVHPVDKNYFVTAGKDSMICIWDIRKWRYAVNQSRHFAESEQSLKSAFFSPVTGKFLLSNSCLQACIFEFDVAREELECCRSMRKSIINSKNKEMTISSWIPNSDDTFACSFRSSSAFHVYDKDLNIYGTVSNDGINGIRRHITFHPFQTALATSTPSRICVSS